MDIIRQVIRDVPDFPRPGIIFKDVTPVLEDSVAFRAVIDAFRARYTDAGIDRIAAVESRGFLLGAALGYELGIGVVMVRKPGKLPRETVRQSYDLEYGSNVLEIHVDAVKPGHRVLVIDDLLATGGTARATADLVHRLGGTVVEHAFMVELGFLEGRKVLEPVPAFALLTY